MKITLPFTAYLLLTSNVLAHPGHSVSEEASERAEYFAFKPRSVNSCTGKLQARGHLSDAIVRRRQLARRAQEKRGLNLNTIKRRDFAQYDTSHRVTDGISFGDDETLLFSDNSSCLLQPEVTQGPFYVDGESIRSIVTEGQQGVPLFLDIQFVDTSTCEPVPAVLVDFWHCNSTGVYSGVSGFGNGNRNDTSNLNATFLRGIQPTDFNGVVQFESIFPGHYTGRATHIHIMSHATGNTTIRTNGTILDWRANGTTHASHVGQLFFDQDLVSRVEALEPYASNTQDITLNKEDWILKQEADAMDPFVQYLFIGDKVEDGILAWVRIGVDSNVDEEVRSAATLYKEGGVGHLDWMIGGPGGPDTPGGRPPPKDPPHGGPPHKGPPPDSATIDSEGVTPSEVADSGATDAPKSFGDSVQRLVAQMMHSVWWFFSPGSMLSDDTTQPDVKIN